MSTLEVVSLLSTFKETSVSFGFQKSVFAGETKHSCKLSVSDAESSAVGSNSVL